MAELLFIATIIFVGYVLFEVVGEKKENPGPVTADPPKSEPSPTESTAPPVEAATAESTVSEPEAVKSATATPTTAKSPRPRTPSTRKAAAPAETPEPVSSDSLKNPKTGEIAKIPANYTFAKRWIKDALVEEGFLDKIYKNNELDDDANSRIHEALQKLQALEKYR